jgi:hypothetical protein
VDPVRIGLGGPRRGRADRENQRVADRVTVAGDDPEAHQIGAQRLVGAPQLDAQPVALHGDRLADPLAVRRQHLGAAGHRGHRFVEGQRDLPRRGADHAARLRRRGDQRGVRACRARRREEREQTHDQQHEYAGERTREPTAEFRRPPSRSAPGHER